MRNPIVLRQLGLEEHLRRPRTCSCPAGPVSTRMAPNRGTQMHTRFDGVVRLPDRVVYCMTVSVGSSPPIPPGPGPGAARGPTSPPSLRHSSDAPFAPMIGS